MAQNFQQVACGIIFLMILVCSHLLCSTCGDYPIMDYGNLTTKSITPVFSDEGYPHMGDIPLLNRKNHRAGHVTIQEHPYIVSIRRNYSHYLTGTLLQNNVVISIAHPLYHVPTYELGAVVGENYADRGKSILSVVLVIIHGKFNPDTLEHDIAMLRIYEDITFSFTVKPLIVSTKKRSWLDTKTAMITGWGRCIANKHKREICLPRSSSYYPYESFDPLLKSIKFRIKYPEHQCRAYHKNLTPLRKGMLCVGLARRENTDAPCLAVPGAPLVVNGNLIGLASWGFACGFYDDLPIVYTDLRFYNFWITHNQLVLSNIYMSDLTDLYTATRSIVLREAYSLTTIVKSMQILLYHFLDPIDEYDTSQMVMSPLDESLAHVRGKTYDVRDFIHIMVFRAAKRYMYRLLRIMDNEENNTKEYQSDEYDTYVQGHYAEDNNILFDEETYIHEYYEDKEYAHFSRRLN